MGSATIRPNLSAKSRQSHPSISPNLAPQSIEPVPLPDGSPATRRLEQRFPNDSQGLAVRGPSMGRDRPPRADGSAETSEDRGIVGQDRDLVRIARRSRSRALPPSYIPPPQIPKNLFGSHTILPKYLESLVKIWGNFQGPLFLPIPCRNPALAYRTGRKQGPPFRGLLRFGSHRQGWPAAPTGFG
jgi:hypothetical protein